MKNITRKVFHISMHIIKFNGRVEEYQKYRELLFIARQIRSAAWGLIQISKEEN